MRISSMIIAGGLTALFIVLGILESRYRKRLNKLYESRWEGNYYHKLGEAARIRKTINLIEVIQMILFPVLVVIIIILLK